MRRPRAYVSTHHPSGGASSGSPGLQRRGGYGGSPTARPPARRTPQRNYRFFLAFVFSTTLLCCWVFALCLVALVHAADTTSGSWGDAVSDHPTAVVLMVYTFLAFWWAGRLSLHKLHELHELWAGRRRAAPGASPSRALLLALAHKATVPLVVGACAPAPAALDAGASGGRSPGPHTRASVQASLRFSGAAATAPRKPPAPHRPHMTPHAHDLA